VAAAAPMLARASLMLARASALLRRFRPRAALEDEKEARAQLIPCSLSVHGRSSAGRGRKHQHLVAVECASDVFSPLLPAEVAEEEAAEGRVRPRPLAPLSEAVVVLGVRS